MNLTRLSLRGLLTVFAGLFMLTGFNASAQNISLSLTGQPTSWLIEGEPYEVKGYGNARLGMTADEVMSVIRKDYPAALPTLKDEADSLTRVRSLLIVLPGLAPGPGKATINYVFGVTTHRLIAINIYWLIEGNTTSEQRSSLMTAATEIASGFVGWQWPPLQVARGHVIGPGVLILFSGKDEAGGGVELRLEGVDFDVERPTQGPIALAPERRIALPGPAQLRLSVVASVDKPDIFRISPGAF